MNKKITQDIVKDKAYALMSKYGKTTTLDVKNALRAEDYWAVQQEISAMMDAIQQSEGWDFHANGRHRTYFLVNPPVVTDDDEDDDGDGSGWWATGDDDEDEDDDATVANVMKAKPFVPSVNASKPNPTVQIPVAEDGCWVAYNTENGDEEYYDGAITRGKARWWHSRSQGITFNQSRARRY